MTRLFIRFYVGVLVVLFLAWYIHGQVSLQRQLADRARVVTVAHSGGARLVAQELNAAASSEARTETLTRLQERFDYQLSIHPIQSLPEPANSTIRSGADVAYDRDTVVAALGNGEEVVRLGSFPDYSRQQIEASIGGWMRLTQSRLEQATERNRDAVLNELRTQFEIPVNVVERTSIPPKARERIAESNDEVAFYSPDGRKRWYSAIALGDDQQAILFGPYPSFENVEQKAATTTLALVLLPAAVAIALLLRPVTRQLRRIENAASRFAAGDLTARVDERSVASAKPLAQAFNHMADQTEALVRTQRELLQAVSHELRTPLARMRFAIDLIGSAQDDEQRNQRLSSLDAATEELNDLVSELMSYVRMETTQPQLSPELVMVSESLELLIERMTTLYPQIKFRNATDTEACVWADRASLRRALGNLLSNAGRHAKSRVVVETSTEGNDTIVEIDDDGQGIPPEDRERVFEPFVRLEAENHEGRTTGSVGLGLALVQRIVSHHGGQVEILDSPLGGCRIRTVWPGAPSGQDAGSQAH